MTVVPLTGTLGSALERLERLCDLERWAEVLPLLRRLVAADPEEDTAWCLLARCYLGLDQPERALDAARTAITLAPHKEWPHRLASYAASCLGRHDDAVSAAREAVRLEPEVWQTHVRLAGAAGQHPGGADEAARSAAHAVALAPHEPEVQLLRGSIAADQGQRAVAEQAYRSALELDPQNSAAHHLLATLTLRRWTGPAGLARAATGFGRALGSDPTAQVSRDGLELTLQLFLGRAAYLLFVTGYLGQLCCDRSTPSARLVPALLLVLPLLYVGAFLRGLDPQLRRYLGRLVRRGSAAVAAALEAGSVVLVLAGVICPQPGRPTLAVLAAATALIARVTLYLDGRRRRRA